MSRPVVHRRRQARQEMSKPPVSGPAEKMPASADNRRVKPVWWHLLVLAFVTFMVYTPALHNDFTNWDDKSYVQNNPLLRDLSFSTVKEIFFSKDLHKRYWMGNYHPLTMLSLNLTYHLYNKDGEPVAWIFILTNILLHILNTLLAYLIVLRLGKRQWLALVAALFFAVHTLHVESVAWISERKDVLYTFFFFWALLEYLNYVETRRFWHYLVSFFLFFLSLLSKGQAVSLAVTLFLVDWFYRRNLFSVRVLTEKLPFLALALVFGLIAIEAQKYSLALYEKSPYALYQRIGIAAYGFAMYLLKLVAPLHLSALYPYPDIINKTVPWYYYAMIIPDLLVVSLFFVWVKKRRFLPAFGLAFFVINIFLLLQLIPVGSAVYADRYSYVPSLGVFIIFAYYLEKIPNRTLAGFITAAYVIFLSYLTFERTGVWRNSLTLWSDTVRKSPKAVVAWNNFGTALTNKAEKFKNQARLDLAKVYYKEAAEKYERAIAGKPDYANAFYNLSSAQYELFLITQDSSLLYKALDNVNKAIAIKLDFTDAYLQRGIIYDLTGQEEKAFMDYKRVLELEPHNARALANIGTYYGKRGSLDTAISYFKKAIKYDPQLYAAYANIGLAFMHLNKLDSAVFYFKKAIEKQPDAISYYNLSLVYRRQGDLKNAIKTMQKALELSPNDPVMLYTMGNLYLESSDRDNACKFYQAAAQKNYVLAKKALNLYCKNKN